MKNLSALVAFLLVSVVVIPSDAYAQEASGRSLFGGGIMPLILIFIFFYLFLLRPQQKKTKEHQALLNALKKDDSVITAGGIYAKVVSVKENIVEIKIADGVNIQVSKPSISAVIMKDDETAAKVPEIVK
ncbi:MAG: preprotein translocase subunit YajC [Endomicrobium sp.]|jgi:preprotein translocase subunit YajC|nr:preprotein translocase subunit YajC [Endomicrobium sp.]